MDSMSRSVRLNLSACPFPCGWYGEDSVFLMSKRRRNSRTTRASNVRPWSPCKQSGAPNERECSCPLGKVVRQDQEISVARRGLFQWPQDVHSHSLQRITRSQGCISARFLTAFLSPHNACTCGTISGSHDLTSQGPRRQDQYLRGTFFSRKSMTMTLNKVFLDNPDRPLLPHHVQIIYCIIMVHGRQQQDAFLSLQDVAHKSELSIEAK
ncbi:hypothetical protein T03_8869 [Trichinella britovi]|uniref:Uncharacterized protein n=1 Tax=Trichinella britovi TaxID=45882 RepID=A0A0V1C8E6_TRIBR|nr:hypothetical protein T03_11714 [Trichinella britovi]KRY45595.1 hypothetical protein T03_16748 [Trichinella britovi]KRY46636.1 hypothetical protein T03_15673 [Trichinella britovi]KRY48116.1 hypothetical protein T03_8869 [Trichinella britovi]